MPAVDDRKRGPAIRVIVLTPYVDGRDRAADCSCGDRRKPEDRLQEAVGLAAAIDLEVRHSEVLRLARRKPGTLFGSGTVERLHGLIAEEGVDLVVVDGALSPVQQRNLERVWNCKVIDRTALILEIFGARAQTHEGGLQVELAALTFQRSRLVRSWTHLERQRGGSGFLGGPGESQIELDRRQIDDRIQQLRRNLKQVTRTRGLHRVTRQRMPYPVIALVGYTNAGKSTLFNRLTGATVMAEDMLFATLDPTMRRVELPSRRPAILSDTVGFISDLPTHLVAAFRATLEEVREADIILHVRDISHPDGERQKTDVEAVLADLGVLGPSSSTRVIEAWNKTDRLDARVRLDLAARAGDDCVAVSALRGDGCDQLMEQLERYLGRGEMTLEYRIAPAAGAAIAWLHRHGRVLNQELRDDRMAITVALASADADRFSDRFGAECTGRT